MGALRRLPLEGAIRIAIPATVVAVALGSNWSPSVRRVAQPLWHLCLGALFVLAVAYALGHAGPRRLWERASAPAYALTALLLALAATSALWSGDPRLTIERAVSFALVVVTGAALGLAAAAEEDVVERLLLSVLAGGVGVALIGLAVLVASPHDALQAATKTIPSRYRGIGQNPNTVAMLFAAAIPLATWLVLRPRRRLLGLAALLLLGGSIAGSGSRGALVAALGGALVVLLAGMRTRRDRVLAAAAALAAFGVGVGITQIPQPDPHATLAAGVACVDCTHRPNDADAIRRLDDELDQPPGADPGERRTFFASTGRTQAWRGAIDQARERPLVGYGFGTESDVFVDRYYSFFGGTPENSYIGMFLQLGLVGLALLVALALALLWAAVAALRLLRGRPREAAAACAAVVAAGLGLALVQSYVYAVGNDATLTVWLCAFLGLALVPRPAARAG